MSVAALRQQIADILAPDSVGIPHLATGLDALDAILPAHGIPRGRVTEIKGARGSGKTALLRQIVSATAARGEWTAYVDATRTLTSRDWARVENLFVARPKMPNKAAWCADILLRSGAFALVVLDSAPPLSRSVSVRLTRLARDSSSALVVVADDSTQSTMLGGALRLRVKRTSARLAITVERGGGGGTRRTIEVSYAISMASRLCPHPEVPDRRGAERTGCRVQGAGGCPLAGGCEHPAHPVARVLPRKKRFGEPNFGARERGKQSRAGAVG